MDIPLESAYIPVRTEKIYQSGSYEVTFKYSSKNKDIGVPKVIIIAEKKDRSYKKIQISDKNLAFIELNQINP